MKKLILALGLLVFSNTIFAEDNEYYVQIAVYDQMVFASHFSNTDNEVYYSKDGLNFHRYFIGKFNEAEAEAESKRIQELGYNTTIVHKSNFNSLCSCYFTPQPKKLASMLQSIFFDFDRYNLRAESKRQLDLLVDNLRMNSSLNTKLRAHTDAKGSDAYNVQLSINRAKSAKNYLISRGISSSRIMIETFGEDAPIAKNKLDNGADTEEGRQFNRRVEILVVEKDGGLVDIVQDINVPSTLEAN